MNEEEENVTIELTQNEALVLFEFVTRFSNDEGLRIEDQAEERVLWDLCSLLEKQLVQPLRKDYQELLAKAREEVRDPVEETDGSQQE